MPKHIDAAKTGMSGIKEAESGLAAATAVQRSQGRLEISDALKRSLEKPAGEGRDDGWR